MAYVYILESLRDGRYYVGSTNNISERIRHHENGYTYSTKRFGGVKLVFKQEFESVSVARKIEMRLKKLKRKDYLKRIINDGVIKMKIEN